jgi:hypothetical protein
VANLELLTMHTKSRISKQCLFRTLFQHKVPEIILQSGYKVLVKKKFEASEVLSDQLIFGSGAIETKQK